METYQSTMNRNEIHKIDLFLSKVIKNINPNYHYIICGSYRRGKQLSNDIDILFLDKKERKDSLHNFIDRLKHIKFIVKDIDEHYKVKYMGYCRLPNESLGRIDIAYIPYNSYYTALIHATGSAEYDIYLRLVAKRQGYKLNQYGLYMNDKKIPIKSERDLFDKLGLTYVLPKDR